MRLKAGDVFEMKLIDGRLGYGVIIESKIIQYIIVLQGLHDQRPGLDVLVADSIAFAGWTSDAMIYHGDWEIVFRGYPMRADIPFPNWKVRIGEGYQTTDFRGTLLGPSTPMEIELLDNQTSHSPITYQIALEGMHGLQPLRDRDVKLTPAYLQRRETRRSSH